jgi:hypothetical protein
MLRVESVSAMRCEAVELTASVVVMLKWGSVGVCSCPSRGSTSFARLTIFEEWGAFADDAVA